MGAALKAGEDIGEDNTLAGDEGGVDNEDEAFWLGIDIGVEGVTTMEGLDGVLG